MHQATVIKADFAEFDDSEFQAVFNEVQADNPHRRSFRGLFDANQVSSNLRKAKKRTQETFGSFIQKLPRSRRGSSQGSDVDRVSDFGKERRSPFRASLPNEGILKDKARDSNSSSRTSETSQSSSRRVTYADDSPPNKDSSKRISWTSPTTFSHDTSTVHSSQGPKSTHFRQIQEGGDTQKTEQRSFFQAENAGSDCIIFVQYAGDTKRAMMKEEDRSMDGIRKLFLRTYLNLDKDTLNSPHIKIYTQDPKSDTFYELEDYKEIKDRSVLRLHDQRGHVGEGRFVGTGDGTLTQPPTSIMDPVPSHPTQDTTYFSESEFHNNDAFSTRKRNGSGALGYQSAAPVLRRYGTLEPGFRNHGTPSSNGVSTLTPQRPGSFASAGGTTPPPPPKPQRYPHASATTPTSASSLESSYSSQGVAVPPPPARSFYASSGITSVNADVKSHVTSPMDNYMEPITPPSAVEPSPLHQPKRPVSRSGSVTPIIDDEARFRMDSMERQLASLSSMVHTALMSQAVNTRSLGESVYRDIESLRKEIFNDDINSEAGSVSRFSDLGSDKSSLMQSEREETTVYVNPAWTPCSSARSSANSETLYPSAFSSGDPVSVGPEVRTSLRIARRRARELQVEVRQLRRQAQVNSQNSRSLLKDAFDRIKVILNTNKHLEMFAAGAAVMNAEMGPNLDRSWVNKEHNRFQSTMQNLDKDIHSVESEVEGLRQRVISGQKRLRVSEVERFTEMLTTISRSAAALKAHFPEFSGRMKGVMTSEMEKVVREERFLKEEPEKIDAMLRRCKKLTSTMVTMKKLALVQDPRATPLPDTASQPSGGRWSGEQLSEQRIVNGFEGGGHPPPAPDLPPQQAARPTLAKPSAQESVDQALGEGPDGLILDSILEELRTVAKPKTLPTTHEGVVSNVSQNNSSDYAGTPGSSDSGIEIEQLERSMQPVRREPKLDYISNRIGPGLSNVAPGRPYNSILHKSPAPVMRSPSESQVQQYQAYQNNVGRAASAQGHTYGSSYQLGPHGRTSLSPATGPSFFSKMMDTANFLSRSRSTTPNSVNSEPMGGMGRHPPPMPPPRSSSRTHTLGPGPGPNSAFKYSEEDIADVKHQLMSDYNQYFSHNGPPGTSRPGGIVLQSHRSTSHTPTPSIQTNAVDEDSRFVRSASSSESVNSQDGSVPRNGPPPPPPPPAGYGYAIARV